MTPETAILVKFSSKYHSIAKNIIQAYIGYALTQTDRYYEAILLALCTQCCTTTKRQLEDYETNCLNLQTNAFDVVIMRFLTTLIWINIMQ